MKKLLLTLLAMAALCGHSIAAEADVYLVKTLHLVDRVHHHVYIDLSEYGAGAHPISTMIRTRYTMVVAGYFIPSVTDYADWTILLPPEDGGGVYEDPDGDQVFRAALEYYYMILASPMWSAIQVSVEGNVSYWPGAPYLPTVVHNKQFSIGVPNIAGTIPPGVPVVPQVFHGFWQ